MVAKQLLLVFGIPKSGTTFLQRMLDMHPEVSCPSEQSFATLTGDLAVLLDRYQKALAVVDRRTGGQGVPPLDLGVRNAVLGAVISALAESFAGGKPVCGLNDNSVIDRFAYYDAILDRPKMIAIFRDPVDTAISAWRHNLRLAKLEPDRAATHLQLLRNPQGTLDGYVQVFADHYKIKADAYLAHADGRPNFITTTYESLLLDRQNELRRLFRFLGCDASPTALAPILGASSREAMAKASADPQFFGVGRPATDDLIVAEDVRRQVARRLHRTLDRLGLGQPAQSRL